MDGLLEKIVELAKDAEHLKRTCRCEHGTPTRSNKKAKRNGHNGTPASPERQSTDIIASSPFNFRGHKLDFEGPGGDGDWVSAFKAEAGPWSGERLVVLSLFDGLGGIWQALTKLGIPFSGYSSEVLAPAIQVVKSRHPRVKHVGDIRKLNLSAVPEKVDLVVGGFPCQDLSIMGKKEGLHGSRSKLFFDLLRVLKVFKPKWFLVENVASMSWVDREEITRHLKVAPMELDSQEITASKRRRLYWTNIPHPPRLPRLRDHPSTSLQSCLEGALALEQKCGVILCSNLYKGSTARLELVLDNKTNKLRYIKQTEVEVLMGYPKDYTNVVAHETKGRTEQAEKVLKTPVRAKSVEPKPSSVTPPSSRQLRKNRKSQTFFVPQVWETKPTRQDSLKDIDRWFLLGNTFSVQVIAYLTSPLLRAEVRSHGKRVNIVGSVKEEELSAMEPGDVWALFNEYGRPNWYAVIESRTGDRFSAFPDATGKRNVTKLPLKIEMKYLEMTPAYLKEEVDEWNPQRGSGLLKLRNVMDIQDNWQAFSHRVTSYVKLEDSYFVYPGNDEVWAVYNGETLSRYFVYVSESTISSDRLRRGKPGQEGFHARCLLLQKTAEHEIFLKTSTMVEFTDLQPFCFRVPFYIKHEANLLKVEVSGVKSRQSMRADKDSTAGYERRGKKDLGGPDDDEDGDLIGGDLDFPEDNDADRIGAATGTPGSIEMMSG
ncbi:uncharacterized protein [Physcomitrium patens]|uniref:DNA (cytosine-5-)-methyltransferase n=2 Tax=Physcomitrium patens TaxID=3218 RepID=A0A2K1JL85_PHYPA|nr:uncharacterized protein LOC112290575 [Physcomitrium patens]XP_024392743.1 uncharacterized protein LOC112290575 [Physcomitrium patens]PNR42291.1 hypothetical protein PHYPA_017120 [Physcomitrium patens]|eukprot:XP_024392742.1 uncharacterized protein LOC112290575 [Physcomitrella patens]